MLWWEIAGQFRENVDVDVLIYPFWGKGLFGVTNLLGRVRWEGRRKERKRRSQVQKIEMTQDAEDIKKEDSVESLFKAGEEGRKKERKQKARETGRIG